MKNQFDTISVIPGDGIGKEVLESTIKIINASGAGLNWEYCEAGAQVFKQGIASGVPAKTLESIKKNKVALKGPLETPVGFGEKSANVTLRKQFETFGNIRPVKEIPGVVTPYSGRGIDLVVVRENVEDLYAGIEHMQTPTVAQCLKIISKKGCEKIIRLAFEVAKSENRKKVHCATKANIMKFSEGLFKKTFEEVSKEYPDIQSEHIIIDNCAHQLVKKPEQFEVIVTTNMNGDIISDLTSALVGGLGFAPSANIGEGYAIFEAVHGSAPKYAGKNVINPTAMILSGVMMLKHIGKYDEAKKIENALMYTFENERKTRDVSSEMQPISTTEFTNLIISHLGKEPKTKFARHVKPLNISKFNFQKNTEPKSEFQDSGLDIFIQSNQSPDELGKNLILLSEGTDFKLKMISNRGTQVFPNNGSIPDVVDHWRCRFMLVERTKNINDSNVFTLINKISNFYRWMHIEKLLHIDGKQAYSKAQGED